MRPDAPQAADLLERRYRRWLLAYPAEYRRERGDELIATLLDVAGPGRSRPQPLDILDLVRVGIGMRLRDLLRELLVAPPRSGNGQIMAFVAFALACLVPVGALMITWLDGPRSGSWAETLAVLPHGVLLAPVVAWLGVAARTRLRRTVVAGLMTLGCVLEPEMTGVWVNLAVAEWLAVLWFLPMAVQPVYPGEETYEHVEG